MAREAVELRAVGAAYEIRHRGLYHVRVNVARSFTLEAVALEAHAGPVLWASEGWLTVAVNGGAATPVGTDRTTGVDLGAFTEGQVKTLAFVLTIPVGTSIRTKTVELYIGLGI
ncbi:MAG TPA: hypothetical protein PLN64_00950 [Candidatus Bipolaricaulis anaerobius]|nr:hypothetical protein [Candidatus Bipolaricaulis anaerobius]